MQFSPLHSCVSVLMDLRDALETDDLSPEKIEILLDDIDQVFSIDAVAEVHSELKMIVGDEN